jgi:small-conductance mechanosensitive channel
VVEVGGSTGRVEDVGIRSTRIKTNDNVDLIVPNSNFLSNVVKNFTRSDIRVRVDIAVGVSYRSDPRQVEAALLRAADHPQVLTSPSTKVEFAGFGDSSLDFNLQVWTNDPLRVRPFSSQIRFRIWDELKAAGIEIPFPQRDIHIRSLDDLKTLSQEEEDSKDDAS